MRSGRHGPSRRPTPFEGCPTQLRTVSVVHEARPSGTHSGWALYRLADPLWRTDLEVIRWGASSGGRRLGPSTLESWTMPPISVLDLAPIPQGATPAEA